MTAVLFDIADGIATLTLNRPERRNPFDAETKEALADALAQVRARSDDVRVLILAGSGGVFSAGGDVRAMQNAGLDAAAWQARMARLHDAVIAPLLTLPCAVIAAVDGPAYGGGFSLALTADIVLASHRARFCMSFLKLGLVPDCGAWWTLPRVVGVQRAKELMLSAREVGAEEALALGIALELHPPEALLPRARALAASLAGASPWAVAAVKRGLDIAQRGDLAALLAFEADAQAQALVTPAHADAAARFLDRQPPRFEWPAHRP